MAALEAVVSNGGPLIDGNAHWFYLPGNGEEKRGPLTTQQLISLLQYGQVLPTMMVWRNGMSEWQEIRAVEDFRTVASVVEKAWSYMPHSEGGAAVEQKGPVHAAALIKMFQEGELDGMSLVWAEGMTEWKALAEVEGLKMLLQMSAADDDDEEEDDGDEQQQQPSHRAGNGAAGAGAVAGGGGEGGGANGTGQSNGSFDPEMMVFVEDEEKQPSLEEVLTKEEQDLKRGYTSDGGTRYIWCTMINDWREAAEGEDEEEEEEEEEEEPAWKVARRAKQLAKLKAKGAGGKGGAAKQGEDGGGEGGEGKGDAGGDESKEGEDEAAAALKKKKKKSKKKRGLAWNDKASKKWIYVKGLPADVTVEEVVAHFSKVGVLAVDPVTQAARVKLYKDEMGVVKGDASLCYAMEGSVDLALQVLDGGQLRPDVPLSVTKAVFQQKGEEFDPSKRLRRDDARVKVAKAAASQALSWNESDDIGVAGKGLKIVVLEHMFSPQDFQERGDEFGLELERDLREECSKLGPVEKITVFSKSRSGVVIVKFGTAFAAEECIKLMDGRYFGGEKLKCHYWDGVTNYSSQEPAEAEDTRIDQFGDWLEEQDLPEELRLRTSEA